MFLATIYDNSLEAIVASILETSADIGQFIVLAMLAGIFIGAVFWATDALWNFWRSLVETPDQRYDRLNGTTDGNG